MKVNIYIFDNRSTSFTVSLSSTGFFLTLLKFDRLVKVKFNGRLNDKMITCVDLYQILQLSKLKFPYLPLEKSFPIILGTVKSMGLFVVRK